MRSNTNEKLKILIPLLSIGRQGGYRVLAELANNWSKQGHDVTVVAYFENEEPYFPIKCNIIWIDEFGNDIGRSKGNFTMSRTTFRRGKGVYYFLKNNSEKYDIVLANQNFSAWPVLLGSKTNNFYYIQAYEPEFYDFKTFKGIILKSLAWLTYFMPFKRVVNSNCYLKYKNLKSSDVVFPGLNLDIFYPKTLLRGNKQPLVVGCIGREEEWKGSKDVATAVSILQKKGLNINLKVAFNPVSECEYQLVKPHGDQNLADYYRSLDVLVAPGHLQLGAVHYPVIEAMACNVPVITTGYYPSNDKNSFIVPIKNPREIARTLELIYTDYNIAVEKANVAYKDVKQFEWKVVSGTFIEIFKKYKTDYN